MSRHCAIDDDRLLNNEFVDFDGFFESSPNAGAPARDSAEQAEEAVGRKRASVVQPIGSRPTASSKIATPRIGYGAVCYEGPAYCLIGASAPVADLGQFLETASDRGGLSRYGCPGAPTWYVALARDGAIAELCHHMLSDCRRDGEQSDWALYQVHIRGRFADLHGRERWHPELVSDDYRCTHPLAREVRGSHLHGILYPSARSDGVSIAAFDAGVFQSYRRIEDIVLRVKSDEIVRVCPRGSRRWRVVHRSELRRGAH
jgi:hypothetical protein